MMSSLLLSSALLMGQTSAPSAAPRAQLLPPTTDPVIVYQTPPPPTNPAAAPQEKKADAPNGNGDDKKDEEEKKEEPSYFLMNFLKGTQFGQRLDDHKIKIYGWTEASYTSAFRRSMETPILFQNPTESFLLNQNWLTIERPVDAEAKEASYGFHIDAIVPGSDARFVQQRGLVNGQTGRYQFDPYQFYVEAQYPNIAQGLNVKVGRVAVPYMAEVTPNIFNPLYSHSYAYYYNPFTHTGLMATLKLSDEWSVGSWFTLGNDVFFDPAATGMWVGILQWTSPNEKDSALICLGLSTGRFDRSENFGNQDHLDVVYTHKFTKEFKYVLDTGIGWENNIPDIERTHWYWFVNYLTYDFCEKASATARLEFFDDTEGFRTGSKGLYTALTGGLTFKPTDYLIIRPELRYDYNDSSRAFGDRRDMITFATDIIIRW